jgi:beta-phosphoglucomutase-like phosphatase (HAD superfamily)
MTRRADAGHRAGGIFDLDGVLVDSEELWDDARRAVAAEAGGPRPVRPRA